MIGALRYCQPGATLRSIVLAAAIVSPLVATVTAGHAEVDLTLSIGPVTIPPPAYFSEQAAVIEMILSGARSCPQIAATLVQKTTRLEAEIAQQQLLDCDRFKPRFDGAPQTIAFRFAVPKVKRESRFEWRFAECDTSGGNCRDLLDIPFDTFPPDLLGSIRKWASRESLVVKDPVGVLADFLDQQGIDFTARRSGIARDSQVVSLLVEDKNEIGLAEMAPYLEKGGVVVFRKSQNILPLIKTRRVAGQSLISVELPLITSLASDPRAQKTLLEIFQMLFERANNI